MPKPIFTFLVLFAFLNAGAQSGAPAVYDLSCNHKVEPFGVDESTPRLAWKIRSQTRDLMQTAYQVRVAADLRDLERGRRLIWDSGRVGSGQSVNVLYAGPPLEARTRYYWQVKVWDNQGQSSSWSAPSWWETARETGDWAAQWIGTPWEDEPEDTRPSPYFRHAFRVRGNIRQARLYITAHGLYEASLNGEKIGDQVFTPGWTSYHKRLQYQTYDVTDMLQRGDNTIGVILGDGWFRGTIGWVNNRDQWGKDLALLAQLEITYANGDVERVLSGPDWKVNTGPILQSEIYHGEIYDARLEMPGWNTNSFDASTWRDVAVQDISYVNLTAPDGVPVRVMDTLEAKEVFTAPNGDLLVDFGQNLVGYVKLKVRGPAGHRITLQHAEVLDKEGNIYFDNLRSARAELEYTLKGSGEEEYAPYFTFMGFRYLKVENWPGELDPQDLSALVVYSDMERTGDFSCSNDLLNQLQHNIQWGQMGNFLDVPTDCPQRDERLGWTGDAQAFSSTAAFNFNVAAFFLKWLQDLEADQLENGAVPHVIPNVLGPNASASAGWADAATIIPWNMYLAYGDTTFLRQQYPSMQKWVEYMVQASGENGLWNEGFHFGDWLFYSRDNDTDGSSAVTDKYLIAQAFFIHSADILAKAARVLGHAEDAELYEELASELREVFRHEYVTPAGRMVSSTQTAFVLALAFDILPESQREAAAARLAANINRYDHLTTGFLGTPYLCHVLSDHGYLDLAYTLLERTDYPSWLYPVTMGATTIWERWDGIKPDSTFQTPSMNSFNHYAYGAIGDWMYKVVAGIDMDEERPGYRHVYVRPKPGGSLTAAEATHESPYGRITSAWKKTGSELELAVTVPPNTRATIELPSAGRDDVIVDGQPLQEGNGIHSHIQAGEAVRIEAGSGTYMFSWPLPADQ